MTRLRITGSLTVVLGGLLFVCALVFLPYFESRLLSLVASPEPTLWDLTTREPLILTIVAGAAVVATVGALLTDEIVLFVLATACSFYLLGRIFPVGLHAYTELGAAIWVATAAAVAMSLGSVLAVAGRSFANRFAKPSQ